MVKKIVILEDHSGRRAEMRRCLTDRFYQFEHHFFVDSAAVIDFLKDHLDDVIVLSLDHDLEMQDRDGHCVDPGTGRAVADYLATRPAVCPVIIHSTNTTAARGMEQVLSESGWKTQRVAPFGDMEWIPTMWFRSLRRLVVDQAKQPAEQGKP